MKKLSLYKVSCFAKDTEYKIVANDVKEAADIFHKLVGTDYGIKEIVYLFEVYL